MSGKTSKSEHPSYANMVAQAIAELKEKGGSSRQAIFKYITTHYNVGHEEKKINAHLKMALKNGAEKGVLIQVKGVGATGSFKVAKKEIKANKPKAKKAKSPTKVKQAAESKATKPKAKAPASPKKPTAKKVTAAKSKKATSPKKTASPKKEASPKKVVPPPKKAAPPPKKAASPKKLTKTKKPTAATKPGAKAKNPTKKATKK